jgi:hypothetical protein
MRVLPLTILTKPSSCGHGVASVAAHRGLTLSASLAVAFLTRYEVGHPHHMLTFSCLSFNATIETNVEGIKVCHIAGRSIGKAWQLRKGKT